MTSDTCHGSTISSADCLRKLSRAQKVGQLYRSSDAGFTLHWKYQFQSVFLCLNRFCRETCGKPERLLLFDQTHNRKRHCPFNDSEVFQDCSALFTFQLNFSSLGNICLAVCRVDQKTYPKKPSAFYWVKSPKNLPPEPPNPIFKHFFRFLFH